MRVLIPGHVVSVSSWISHLSAQHFAFIVCKIRLILTANIYRVAYIKALYKDKINYIFFTTLLMLLPGADVTNYHTFSGLKQ